MLSNRLLRGFLSLAAITFFATACHSHELPEVDCDAVAPPAFAEVALFETCVLCHASTRTGADRFGAPSGVDYDTYEAAAANAEHGVELVYLGLMPPTSEPEQGEMDAFYNWGLCGTPQ